MPLKLWRGDATLMRRMTWWRNITEFYFLSSRPAFKRGGQVDEYKILWKEKAVERTSHYILIAVPTCNFVIGGPLFAYWRHTFCMSGQKKNSFVYSHFRDSAERGSWYILCLVYLFQSRHVVFFCFWSGQFLPPCAGEAEAKENVLRLPVRPERRAEVS